MSGSSTDPIAVTALVVSLVALVVALLQAAQQYAATAYDYRHCSTKSMGGWAKLSRRKFIWKELRYEVTYKSPIISVHPRPAFYITRPTNQSTSQTSPSKVARLSSFQTMGYGEPRTQYHFTSTPTYPSDVPSITKQLVERHNAIDKPWFLSSAGTVPEAKCSWLTLLEDTAATDLQVYLSQRKGSYDFMPDGVNRPLASIDRKSFLTLMSLFRIKWQEGENPTGAGDFCELTCRNILNFGTVYYYGHSRVRELPSRRSTYFIPSEKAQAAMFHRFDLEFYTVLTHSAGELYDSLLGLVPGNVASTVRSFNAGSDGWSPGLSEAICCWAETSMPKAINEKDDTFTSIFSARPTVSFFGEPSCSRLLCGDTKALTESNMRTISKWADNYMASSPEIPANDLYQELRWASLQDENRNNMTGSHIEWSRSKRCLKHIEMLDDHLRRLTQQLKLHTPVLDFQRQFARLQIRYGCTLFPDASEIAKPNGFWKNYIPYVVAANYVKLSDDLLEIYLGQDQLTIHSIIINRLMRGALWTIHNGNAPNQEDRELECSLNSKILSDRTTIFIA